MLTLLLVAGLAGCGNHEVPAAEARHGHKKHRSEERAQGDKGDKVGKAEAKAAAVADDAPVVVPEGDVPDVVLVVLDTVRADHTSLCGYWRPTTPFLRRLVAQHHARHTCEGVAPASWTLPSHATYFTGVLLPEHHYDSLKVPDWSTRSTLADQMAAKGYATVLVTANPVLTKARGLTKGFEVVASAAEIHSWRGPDVPNELRKALTSVDPRKPWFVVVNLMDAHDPYPAIPNGQGWVPERPKLDFHVKDREHPHPYHQFLGGELDEQARTDFLQAVTDGYDWGISQADAGLRGVLGVLEKRGRIQHGVRLVVTADHGEFLGEHGLLRHGGWLWEPGVRVPLLVADTRKGATVPELPKGPLSTAVVFDLLRDGALPATPRPPVAFESASNFAENPGSNTVALWTDTTKLVWTRDGVARYDLAADPGETSPAPAQPRPPRPLDRRLQVAGRVAGVTTGHAGGSRDAARARVRREGGGVTCAGC
jgi:hypothetical protein